MNSTYNPLRHLRPLVMFASCLWLLLLGCRAPALPPPVRPVTVKILATTDVHGWLNPNVVRKSQRSEGGLAELAAVWRAVEGHDLAEHTAAGRRDHLVLDSGDMWTGPPESTLLEGAPLIDAFNTLAYDAGVVGNHEFDFGLSLLLRHAQALRFPLLAANLERVREDVSLEFRARGAKFDLRGVSIGVIGLAFRDTPHLSFPRNVDGLAFGEYLSAVRAEADRLLEAGADVLVVIAHDEVANLRPVAEATADLPIRLFLGGHNHQRELEVLERDPRTDADDVILLNTGCFARAYGRVELQFAGGELVGHSAAVIPVEGPLAGRERDPALARIVEEANEAVKPRLQEVIGRAQGRIEIGTVDHSPLGQLVADSWLERFPQAQIAITNIGGIRQPLDEGPVIMGHLLGVLPFANDLVMVELTPAQLREVLSGGKALAGGLRYRFRIEDGQRVVTRLETLEGQPLEEARRYRVITTDFLYHGGDKMSFQRMDAHPVALGVSWRDPLVDLFRVRGEQGVPVPTEPRALPE